MKKIIIIWTIVAVLMVSLLTFIGFKILEKREVYYDLEANLNQATKDYMLQNPDYLPAKKSIVSSNELLAYSLIKPLKVNGDICEGYTEVIKKYLTYEYKSYIKCKEYTTQNYEAQLK